MLLTRLLVATLLLLVAGRTAASQQIAQKTDEITAKTDYVQRFESTVESSRLLETASSRTARQSKILDEAQRTDDVCLTLHTFVMARDSQTSDATHLISHRTCTPGRQFEMKSTVLSPSRDK
jgi:hypothetical protein